MLETAVYTTRAVRARRGVTRSIGVVVGGGEGRREKKTRA
jgi:hypothetical protein